MAVVEGVHLKEEEEEEDGQALNLTWCATTNLTELERLNATEGCAAMLGPPLPIALMTVIQVCQIYV